MQIDDTPFTSYSAAEFAKIFDDSLNEIYIFDAATLKFVYVNRGARENLGYDLCELKRLTPLDLKPEFRAEQFQSLISPLRTGAKEKIKFETKHLRKDGSSYPVEVSLQHAEFCGKKVFLAIILDVTERKATLAALEESEARYERAMRGSAVGLWDWKVGTNEIYYSTRFKTLLGYDNTQFASTVDELSSKLHPNDTRRCKLAINAHLKRGTALDVECRLMTKSNGYRWFRIRGIAERPSGDQPSLMTGSIADVTDRRNMQEQLAAANSQMNAVFDAASEVSMVATDPDGTITLFNRGAVKLLGYREDELVGKQTPAPFHLESEMVARSRELTEEFGRPIEGFRVFVTIPELVGVEEREWTYVCKDGTHRVVNLAVTCMRNPGGEIVGYLGVAVDLTRRKEAEAELEKLALVAAKTHQAVVITDARGKTEWVNDAFTRISGYKLAELHGRTPGEVLQGAETDPAHVEAFRQAVRNRQAFKGEIFNYRKDGTGYWIESALTPIFFQDGELKGFIAVQSEITDRKAAEAALQTAKEAAELANLTKSEFLANTNHELRTPMTAILGYTDVLLEKCSDDDDRECLSTIKRNGEHLLEIINDILDLSKVESGRLEIEQIASSPAHAIDDVVRSMQVRADGRGISLTTKVGSSVPPQVLTDPTRFRQILINLLGNAIKFTEVGGVEIFVDFKRSDNDSGILRVSVSDSGIGMTESQIDGLFQPFVQADTSTTRKYGGTGLGLTVSRRLAERLGGDITAESTAGVGSTFTLEIKVGLPDHESTKDSEQETKTVSSGEELPDLSGIRVLLAEDGPDNQRLISFLLRKAGADVVQASNGRIAIDQVHARNQANQQFDVILMDMQMPVLDGYGATRQLRSEGYAKPIIALTAHAMSGDRENCLAAGCDEYTVKPIDRSQLLGLVYQAATSQLNCLSQV